MAPTRIGLNGKKSNQREITQKVRKREQSFLHVTHCLDLIHLAMKFRQNIPYGYVVMVRTRIVCVKKLKKGRNSESKKGI